MLADENSQLFGERGDEHRLRGKHSETRYVSQAMLMWWAKSKVAVEEIVTFDPLGIGLR